MTERRNFGTLNQSTGRRHLTQSPATERSGLGQTAGRAGGSGAGWGQTRALNGSQVRPRVDEVISTSVPSVSAWEEAG